MGVAKRGRRKIIVDGRSYRWFVTDNREVGLYRLPDGHLRLLFLVAHIISEDKKFNVSYAFDQQDLPEPYLPHLFVLGRDFPGLLGSGKYIATPRWNDSRISTQFIRNLIMWCMDKHKTVIEVNAIGKPLASITDDNS